MFAAAVRWKLEECVFMLRITGIAPLMPISGLNEGIQRHLIGKMVDLINYAEKFEGEPMDIPPTIPQDSDTLIVASTIIFNSHANMDAFKREFPNILNQE